jgi:hypothetical protein
VVTLPHYTHSVNSTRPARVPIHQHGDLHCMHRTRQTAAVGTHIPPGHHTRSTAAGGRPHIPSQLQKQGQMLPLVAGWDRTHAVQALQHGMGQRQVQRHSRVTPMASRCASECAWNGETGLLKQVRLACVSRSASFVEVARKVSDRARHVACAAHASVGVDMASCIPACEPVAVQQDTLVDRLRARKACRVHPRRRRVGVEVLTQEDTNMLRYMRVRMWVLVA